MITNWNIFVHIVNIRLVRSLKHSSKSKDSLIISTSPQTSHYRIIFETIKKYSIRLIACWIILIFPTNFVLNFFNHRYNDIKKVMIDLINLIERFWRQNFKIQYFIYERLVFKNIRIYIYICVSIFNIFKIIRIIFTW